MIITSQTELEVGKVYGQRGTMSDSDGVYHRVSFLVLGPATWEDFVAQAKEEKVPISPRQAELVKRGSFKIYRVSMD